MNYKDLLIIGKAGTATSIKSKRDINRYKKEIFDKQLTEIKKDKLDIVNRIISLKEKVFEVDEKYHNFLDEILKIYYLGYSYSVIIAIGSITEELSKVLLSREKIIINGKQVTINEKEKMVSRLNQEKLIANITDDKTKGNLHEIRLTRNKCMHDFKKLPNITVFSKKIIKLFLIFLEKYFKPER